MKLSERTIAAIAKVVTGDSAISPYRSGPVLVRLFNEFGANDVYAQGFPSRWFYTEEKIRSLNGSQAIEGLLREILDPRDWREFGKPRDDAVAYLNEYLKHDGYELVPDEDFFGIRALRGGAVAFEYPSVASRAVNQLFIDEQVNKCDKKLRENDFDGAITNARSLVEAVLLDVEQSLAKDPVAYDGDLAKLYRRVQRLLNLDPGRKDISDSVKQVLGGLSSIVFGIASLSNRMGDRHARSYKPAKRHALLVVNAAKTVAGFVIETREQLISEPPGSRE
ncbi:MAG TPA: abortive infection family protein [Candidatus Binataceae bacterium]|nr:abortive infection family protein [Candidatus Binataceae bacterium]